MIKLATKIGKHNLQIEFKDMKSLHKFGGVYGGIPQKCTSCGSDNLFLSYKNPKGNDYYMLECGDCHATANFGQHKDGGGLYWKNEPMEKYVAQQGQQQQQQSQQQPNVGFADEPSF